MISRIATILAVSLGLQFSTGIAHAMKIQSVTSPGGIKAWLVEEHALPLLTMTAAHFLWIVAQTCDVRSYPEGGH